MEPCRSPTTQLRHLLLCAQSQMRKEVISGENAHSMVGKRPFLAHCCRRRTAARGDPGSRHLRVWFPPAPAGLPEVAALTFTLPYRLAQLFNRVFFLPHPETRQIFSL